MELGLKIINILELKQMGVQKRTSRQYQVVVFEHDKDVFKGMFYLENGIKLHPGDQVLASLLLTGKAEQKRTSQGQLFTDYSTFFILNKCIVVGHVNTWTPPQQNPQWVPPQPQQQTINEQEYNTTRQAQLQEQEQDQAQEPTDDVLPDWMNDLGADNE